MKILVIHGSPRRGNTWEILNLVKEKIDNQVDIEYDILELSKVKLETCIGCFNCILRTEKKCPHFDVMKNITQRIEDSDAMIITSPVYSLQISGILKNFIDHMSYNFHRPKYFTKKAFIVTTTAGVSEKKIANYLEEVLNFWGITSVYKVSLKYRGTILEKDNKKIDTEVNRFVKDLRTSTHKAPTFKNVAYYNAWRAMSTILCEKGSPDYDYWMESELYKYTYHPDIKIGKFKAVFGNVLYKTISKKMAKNKKQMSSNESK